MIVCTVVDKATVEPKIFREGLPESTMDEVKRLARCLMVRSPGEASLYKEMEWAYDNHGWVGAKLRDGGALVLSDFGGPIAWCRMDPSRTSAEGPFLPPLEVTDGP